MTQVRWERYPLVAQSPYARSWLSMQGNLGLAQNTVEAYGRALEDYLAFSTRDSFSPEAATREHIARYVRQGPLPETGWACVEPVQPTGTSTGNSETSLAKVCPLGEGPFEGN